MEGALLDTNIIIDLLRTYRSSRPKSQEHEYNSQKVIEFFETLIEKRIKRYISCHTIKELLQYPYISQQEEDRIRSILPKFTGYWKPVFLMYITNICQRFHCMCLQCTQRPA